MNQIAQDCGGVTMSFPRPTSKSSRVVLKGPKDCIAAAKKRVEEIIEDLVRLWQNGSGKNLYSLSKIRILGCVNCHVKI